MSLTERHSIRCCDDNGRLLSNNPDVHCFPITIPEDDPVFSKFNRECMNFVRSTTDQETGCNPGNKPAEQVITHEDDSNSCIVCLYRSDENSCRCL